MTRRALRLLLVPALTLSVIGCGARLMKLPQGPGAAAPDAAAALQEATSVCRGVRTLTAEVGASGKAAGSRFRGRLSVGVLAPASARIEAVAPFGPPVFIFAATGDEATLLLPREDRVLQRGRPDQVLDAVAGVPLTAADLHTALTGCAAPIAQPQGHERGADWRTITDAGGDELYLHRTGKKKPWQLVAVVHQAATPGRAWRAEYRNHQNGLPRTIRLTSAAADGSTKDESSGFDLTLDLSQVETNVPLEANVFVVEIPASAAPITIDELRNARPGVRKN